MCVLYSISVECTVLYYTALRCPKLHCAALHCTSPHCAELHNTELCFEGLHCTLQHCFVKYVALFPVPMHWIKVTRLSRDQDRGVKQEQGRPVLSFELPTRHRSDLPPLQVRQVILRRRKNIISDIVQKWPKPPQHF